MIDMNTHDGADKDIPRLLNQALRDAKLSQQGLAQRLARIRPCSQCGGTGRILPFARRKEIVCPSCDGSGQSRLASQDQQIRRIRRFRQLPTEEYAADMARAFAPELELPADYFFVPRETAQQSRDAMAAWAAAMPEIQKRIATAEKEIALLRKELRRRDDDDGDKRGRSA